jgi:ribosome-binding ATPase YchF (GTP1/OBG family)
MPDPWLASATMELGLVGKPNVGKSTFFGAVTMAPVESANYPFTTIEANRGMAYVRTECPHVQLGLDGCDPNNAPCRDGVRWVPVEVTDVAGLVPGAHEGKGLGNKFLDDVRHAQALVHVVDAAGATDAEGEPVDAGTHDPREDVGFLEDEIEHWLASILARDLSSAARKVEASGVDLDEILHDRVSGMGIARSHVVEALREADLDEGKPSEWAEEDTLAIAHELRRIARPILVAANKADLADDAMLDELAEVDDRVVPTCAEAELALRRAADADLVDYQPGDERFEIVGDVTSEQREGLEQVRETVFDRFGSTGVQSVLETGVYEVLDRIVVFPVDDASKFADGEGNVLPDALLVPKGTTAEGLAYQIHSDIGENFVQAEDARTSRTIGADHELENGDVIRIVADD